MKTGNPEHTAQPAGSSVVWRMFFPGYIHWSGPLPGSWSGLRAGISPQSLLLVSSEREELSESGQFLGLSGSILSCLFPEPEDRHFLDGQSASLPFKHPVC